MGYQVFRHLNQMGCNCCRMLNRDMFKPQELQANCYVNEAPVYEHDRSKSPTIKISELMNEGHNVIERDTFTAFQDSYNAPEKINAKNDEASFTDLANVSSYTILNINFVGEIQEQDGHPSQSDHNLENKPNSYSLEQNMDLQKNSDEPECIQHELSNSIQENSLTESAILEVGGSKLSLDIQSSISNSSDLNELSKNEDCEQQTDIYPKDKTGSLSSTACIVPIKRSKESSLIALMIERSSARGSKKASVIANGIQSEDDLDADVAEALAALAAAIAGEDFDDV